MKCLDRQVELHFSFQKIPQSMAFRVHGRVSLGHHVGCLVHVSMAPPSLELYWYVQYELAMSYKKLDTPFAYARRKDTPSKLLLLACPHAVGMARGEIVRILEPQHGVARPNWFSHQDQRLCYNFFLWL